ncbi:MAG: hypothetical protein JWR20_2821 [Marmoricola sp.]|nr:hypothetical protein [Marmoricola sp.]
MAGPAALAVDVSLDSTTWAALALVLTLIGAAVTVLAWRRRGLAPAMRALAWTLVPVALWLTGTLRLVVAVVDDVASWATRLVFSPTVWAGIVVAGLAVVLWWVSGRMLARGIGVRAVPGRGGAPAGTSGTREVGAGRTRAAGRTGGRAAGGRRDDGLGDVEGMDDIEAILRKHGI